MKSNKIKISSALMERSGLTYGDMPSYSEVLNFEACQLRKGKSNKLGLNIC